MYYRKEQLNRVNCNQCSQFMLLHHLVILVAVFLPSFLLPRLLPLLLVREVLRLLLLRHLRQIGLVLGRRRQEAVAEVRHTSGRSASFLSLLRLRGGVLCPASKKTNNSYSFNAKLPRTQ